VVVRVVSWNMGAWTPALRDSSRRENAWERLVELRPQPDLALLQEATDAPARLGLESQLGGLGNGRAIGSLIWSPRLPLVEPARLQGIGEHGYIATGRVASGDREIALVSFHARTGGPGSIAHVEALLDRLGDWISRRSFILAGDFNSCRLANEAWPGYRHLEFFKRVEADYGMFNCYWQKHGEERRTYWKDCQGAGNPFQDDHIFVSSDLGPAVRSCEVLDYEQFRGISDHAPIMAELDLDG
jgi:endonuclease/exonuclease/phosphatase (EEP) superfamily protein YafD